MVALTFADDIAIAQIVYYAPAILGCIFLCIRHGFTRSSGWILLVTFCTLRIIGASATLYTISNPTETAWTIALVCSAIGTSPLLLASLGLLSRIYYSILPQGWSTWFQTFGYRIIQLPALVALILCIVGATSASNPAQMQSETTFRVGIVLFLVVYLMLVAMACFAISNLSKVPDQERVLLKAVVLGLPFLLVHIIYSLLVAFSGMSDFNPITGSKIILLCMSVIEEMLIVLFYMVAGFRAKSTPLPRDTSPAQVTEYRARRGDYRGGRSGLVGLAFGAASAIRDKDSRRNLSSDSNV